MGISKDLDRVPALYRLLANHDPSFLLLGRTEKLELSGKIFLYVFRGISSSEMGNSLKEVLGWSGSQCLAFRKELKGHGYLQKSLKFWAYAALVKRSRPKSAAPVHRSDFDVKKADALWLKALIESGVPTSRALCRFVRKYRVEYTPVTTAEFDKQAEAVLSDLFVTCRKFVHRKFRFLTQSGQLEGSNIVSELMESALRAMYRAYPVIESPLHMKNIGIRTIHNVGINIIKEQTTQSRQRVVKNADGTFSGTLLSLSQGLRPNDGAWLANPVSGICTSLIVGLHGSSVDGEHVSDVNRSFDLRTTLDQIQSRMGSKQRQFVDLLTGEYDLEFSEFLGVPNDELIDRLSRLEYANKVREYLQINVPAAREIVHTLRDGLKGFCN